ncbi:unnamed protein product [Polarella glacialis]|uniref:Alpha N-terminal protein methyltransferase 1 n=1 Tax=Polarella glacialis TaxID=89957 RepID=A0A813L6U8_POLGL|nr:unnamed protein product [Polarella glacialis]CAE8718036.1 unnamed protein product [Polarella glacialis]
MEGNGGDNQGAAYQTVGDLWKAELASEEQRKSWYQKGTEYWDGQEASINGVLGGYPETHGPDIRESRRFLDMVRLAPNPPTFGTVLDCGAGIGRVTSGLLLSEFQVVDLVEPNQRLLDQARKEITDQKAERFVASSLESFEPELGRYDVIWAQWVLLYLPDDDLIAFFQRCIKGLKQDGWLFVKENVVIQGNFVVDKEDNSISRTDAHYKEIFRKSGLSLEHEITQAAWPSDLIPVRMYALRPSSSTSPSS